jgi:predicted alpha/beta hydrolase family esterase
VQTSKRPIIFVAHSLGGIIVKSVGDIVKGTLTFD